MNKARPGILIAILVSLMLNLGAISWGQDLTVKGHLLEIDGIDCGLINGFSGGEFFISGADLSGSTRKGPEDITISFGPGLTRRFYEWVQSFPQARSPNGSIVTFNTQNKEISRLTFTEGSIFEIVVPPIRKDVGNIPAIAIRIHPRTVHRSYTPAGIPFLKYSSPLIADGLRVQSQSKGTIKTNSYFLQIQGLDHDCGAAVKIEAFPSHPAPEGSAAAKTRLQILSVIITFGPLPTTELFTWQEDFIVRGNDSYLERKDGKITCYESTQPQNGKETIAISFSKLAITRLAQVANNETINWRAEMDMDIMDFKFDFDSMVTQSDRTSSSTSPAQPTTLNTSTSSAPPQTEPTSKSAAPVKEGPKARLFQLLVSPNVNRIELRDSLQFKAVALYQDNTTQDLTNQVEWSSGDYSVIEVFKDGLATAKSLGKAEVFATYQGIEGQSEQILVIDPSKVKEGRIVQIFVSPNTLTLKPKDSYQFTATALFSDKATMDITDKVEWYAGDYTVVEVFEDGLATAKKPGKTTIFATYKEIEGESEEITVLGSK